MFNCSASTHDESIEAESSINQQAPFPPLSITNHSDWDIEVYIESENEQGWSRRGAFKNNEGVFTSKLNSKSILSTNDFKVTDKIVYRVGLSSQLNNQTSFEGLNIVMRDTPVQIQSSGSKIINGNILESYIHVIGLHEHVEGVHEHNSKSKMIHIHGHICHLDDIDLTCG